MSEYVEIKIVDLKKAEKKAKFRETLRAKARAAVDWVEANKGAILLLAPPVLGAATSVVRTAGKQANLRREQNLKELYCYDRSLGHYWKLKRKLTNSDWLEINARRDRGEKLADILSSMKVLK